MNGTWYNLPRLQLLWLLPVFIGLFLYATYRRRQALRLFLGSPMLPKLTASVSPGRRFLRSLLLLLAMVFIVLALARPAWNPVPQTIRREGRDVLFLLDVSRSMLADDLKPNRLERAKLAIDDCLQVLQGDRVALVVFAGNAVVRCPLTQDYGFFRMMLADVSTDSVSRGGTLIGDALRKAANDVFDQQDRQYKDIVLITDGEDHESFPLEAAKTIGEAGIRLIAVGLGDEDGTPIVVQEEDGSRNVLRYQGEIVRSQLDSDTLREMVNATPGGRYLPVATGNIDLDKVYLNLIASAAKREIESQTLERYEEKFQIFLLLAIVCLALLALLSDRRKVVQIGALMMLIAQIALAASPQKLLQSGNAALADGQYDQALDFYRQAGLEEPESPYLTFNQALVYFQQEDFTQAIPLFKKAATAAQALQPPDLQLAARCQLALGNSQFRECYRQEDSDLQKAIEACKESILHYQEALRLQPDWPVAKDNLLATRLTLKKLLNILKEMQKQQQEQQKKQQEQAKKLQELAEKQEQAADNSSQAQQSQDKSSETSAKLQDEQQQISQETDELAEQRQASADDPVQKNLEQAQEKQQEAQEALAKNKPAEAEKKQREAAESLKKAKEEMDKQQREQEQQQGQKSGEQQSSEDKQPSPGDEEQPGEEESQKSGEESAQEQDNSKEEEKVSLSEDARDILDDERKNQKQRQLRRPQAPRPVDKDW